ncbi:transcriptional regulator, LacI family [Paramicrobacterium humi]|uniref:Transcriptional regulator, LacI family n=1 Tax=Paramicrobacterium humi TaxID=640635 RepID=A0A1H4J5J5_9MICO|nr:LacI family DNA-binding transcriptional regulator [Microbacterium humi]SEB41629.1 transcriptional regulator, LacI family [Microbacterium humi]
METTASVTLHDVAREAGVSLATASRALNGSSRKVADSYRERVQAAALKLGYTPNLSAQAVARGRTNTIGLLVGDIADPYFSTIAAGAMAAAAEAGLIVTLAVTGRDAETELEIVRTLRGQRPRALLLAGSRFADAEREAQLTAELQSFTATGGNVVFISQGSLPFASVQLDNFGGAKALGAELGARGYRRVAIVAGPETLITSADRVAGFRAGLAEHGVAVETGHVAHADFSRDGGYDAGGQLVSRGLDGIELVLAASDVMAIGAMSALREAGLEPGRDIGVAGFDDISTARDVTPPLTTVAIPLETVGRIAVERALAEDYDAEASIVTGDVVVRSSTPRSR